MHLDASHELCMVVVVPFSLCCCPAACDQAVVFYCSGMPAADTCSRRVLKQSVAGAAFISLDVSGSRECLLIL